LKDQKPFAIKGFSSLSLLQTSIKLLISKGTKDLTLQITLQSSMLGKSMEEGLT
jgi:hypothetical protein